MDRILLDHFDEHYALLQQAGVAEILKAAEIEVLDRCQANRANISKFYQKYVYPHRQQIALCGINPGRLGAGKSGIPFVDCAFLSELLGEYVGNDIERSARFFRDVVSHFGPAKFYSTIHVTNISTYGFRKEQRNLNYYDLDDDIVDLILKGFAREIQLMKIGEIVPCNQHVHATLTKMEKTGLIRVKIHPALKHPNWCAFPGNRAASMSSYLRVLGPLIECHLAGSEVAA